MTESGTQGKVNTKTSYVYAAYKLFYSVFSGSEMTWFLIIKADGRTKICCFIFLEISAENSGNSVLQTFYIRRISTLCFRGHSLRFKSKLHRSETARQM